VKDEVFFGKGNEPILRKTTQYLLRTLSVTLNDVWLHWKGSGLQTPELKWHSPITGQLLPNEQGYQRSQFLSGMKRWTHNSGLK